ncbi:MAG: NmrA family NAD(P)-binding protein [Sphingomonadales bacterium]|nr:NmrA family NAD(P)-binding protein [Sphingomonadales bacterium]
MTKPLILVTGATGKTGRAVVDELLNNGAKVRAMVHRRDARAAALERAGAEVVTGDLFDFDSVEDALKGVSRAYFAAPMHPFALHAAAGFAEAARAARLESVVQLTQWLANPANPSLTTRSHWLADRLFDQLPGIAHTTVSPGFFADNYIGPVLPFIAHLGVLPQVWSDGPNAPPSNEDIAAVAAHALLDPKRHDGRTYRPTGPREIRFADMRRDLETAFGRRLRVMPMPLWMFTKAMLAAGFTPEVALDSRSYIAENERGTFGHGGPTDHVREVTGRDPDDFLAIARRYAALPEAQPGWGRFAAAVGLFLRTGMTPNVDLDRYARRHKHPQPANPRLAIDDPRWQEEHGGQVYRRTALRLADEAA